MFSVTKNDIDLILDDFGICAKSSSITELQRYHYEKDDPDSKEVRLIVRADLDNGQSIVIRFKNEEDVSLDLVEKQCAFAELLQNNGISCPAQYKIGDTFAKWYVINGYQVIVTVEAFVEGEIKLVDENTAEQTGTLLAQMHAISQRHDFHVNNDVLFDPFSSNDLFSYELFSTIAENLAGEDRALCHEIAEKYTGYMEALSPLQTEPRYAVQGDISVCNLYRLSDNSIGVFDFNRCGDNILFCDAVMQAVFEARLMDYPDESNEANEAVIFSAFLKGYTSIRPFTEKQKEWVPCLLAIIHAFWSFDIRWKDDSLQNEYKRGNMEAVHAWLLEIRKRLFTPIRYPF